jgi:tRNA_anti-like
MKATASRFNRCFLLILSLLLTSVPLFAQYTDRLGGNWNNPASAMITNIVMDRLARRRLEKRLGVKPSGPGATPRTTPSGASEAAPPINDASVRFRSTGTQLKTREISDLFFPGSGPDNQRIFTILTAVLQEFDKGARKAGKPNDLALALSFFFATNASVYHDAGEPPDPQMLELRDTIAGALVEGNALNGVTDRQKQEMYETLVLYTGFALVAYQEAKQLGNADSLNVSRQLAGQNLQAVTGMSPEKITFTAEGLSIDNGSKVAVNSTSATNESSNSGIIDYNVIAHAYEDNEVGAEATYGGKRIRVSGRVASVKIEKGRIQVQFVTPMARHIIFNCYFPMSQKSAVGNLKRDQVIVVEGTCRGSEYTGVILEDCILR